MLCLERASVSLPLYVWSLHFLPMLPWDFLTLLLSMGHVLRCSIIHRYMCLLLGYSLLRKAGPDILAHSTSQVPLSSHGRQPGQETGRDLRNGLQGIKITCFIMSPQCNVYQDYTHIRQLHVNCVLNNILVC